MMGLIRPLSWKGIEMVPQVVGASPFVGADMNFCRVTLVWVRGWLVRSLPSML